MKTNIKSILNKLFRENIGIKIGSVILSLTIWLFIISQQEAEVSFEVPLKIMNIPRGIVLTNKSTTTVQVRVRGITSELNLLTENQIQPTIILGSNVKPGDLVYNIRVRDFRDLPQVFNIVSISPSTVELKLERESMKVVPITVSVKGEPAEGYEIAKTIVKPKTIRVTGPKSIIKNLESIPTETIDVTNKSIAWEARANLTPPSNLVNLMNKKTVEIQIWFKKKIGEITLMNYQYKKITPDNPTKFKPEEILVTLEGPVLTLNKLKGNPSDDLIIVLDASKLSPGKHVVPLKVVKKPADITKISLDPKKITVLVKKTSSTKKSKEKPGTKK